MKSKFDYKNKKLYILFVAILLVSITIVLLVRENNKKPLITDINRDTDIRLEIEPYKDVKIYDLKELVSIKVKFVSGKKQKIKYELISMLSGNSVHQEERVLEKNSEGIIEIPKPDEVGKYRIAVYIDNKLVSMVNIEVKDAN